jgi:photosynthetic reaction center H subunit
MTFFGNFDLAQLVLYLFWIFFFGLIIYIQRETMREGYPMEAETDGRVGMYGPFTMPSPKTFLLPHGQGTVTVPNPEKDAKEITDRKFAMQQRENWGGAPYVPTGDAMVDGVGPGSWAERRDIAELTMEGDLRIVPMASTNEWTIADGERNIVGWDVIGCDGQKAGTIKDVWIDRSESMIRYIEVALTGQKSVLAPMNGVVVNSATQKSVYVDSITAAQFAKVPTMKKKGQVTSLEEEKIMAYYAAGKLYAEPLRSEPWL